jgi:hypothetical protein
MDGLKIAPCIFRTPTILGGRISQRARDGGAVLPVIEKKGFYSRQSAAGMRLLATGVSTRVLSKSPSFHLSQE